MNITLLEEINKNNKEMNAVRLPSDNLFLHYKIIRNPEPTFPTIHLNRINTVNTKVFPIQKNNKKYIRKKKKKKNLNKYCLNCNTNVTPQWRKGPDGMRSLCNACGLRFLKVIKKEKELEGSQTTNRIHIRNLLN
eukprot:TRINITY_DN5203_c0_g1_i1.p1 TRINITY_DN5203_c0_g1~~TRINITY_DN5203_c0_g1_i1.p1  ORF type:complete len:135 (+),score=14.31 TRINITY_DN5203_c0_g1_i1:68-472(+)